MEGEGGKFMNSTNYREKSYETRVFLGGSTLNSLIDPQKPWEKKWILKKLDKKLKPGKNLEKKEKKLF